METTVESQRSSLKISSSMKKSPSNAIGIGTEHDQLVKYTSLKDVLSAADYLASRSSIFAHPSFYGGTSTLSVRNHLLKHAATAYLQSGAATLAARDQSWLARLWRRSRQYAGFVVGSVRAMEDCITRQALRLCQ